MVLDVDDHAGDSTRPRRRGRASFLLSGDGWPYALVPFIPLALLLAVIIVSHITGEGQSTWFEGLMLLALYAVVAAAFFFG